MNELISHRATCPRFIRREGQRWMDNRKKRKKKEKR